MEIKIGSIVTKGFGIKLGSNLRFNYEMTGLVVHIQSNEITILKLTGKHELLNCKISDFQLSNSIFNRRFSLSKIKEHETRNLITLTLKKRGYSISLTPINISNVDLIHNEVEYIQDGAISKINIDPISNLSYGYIIRSII